ncbi:MAG TPA: thioredoxin fold domain-containing protein [Cytophagaceae bacterium]|jgi:thioredoxin-related protein
MKYLFLYTAITATFLFSCKKHDLSSASQPDATTSASLKKDIVIAPSKEGPIKNSVKEVKWLTIEEATKLSEKEPRKIFVDVYTDWCGWCKKMDKSTLKDPAIMAYLNKKYYAVKLNAESSKSINYKGKVMTEGELATRVFNATGFPTTVYLDPNMTVLQPVPGYLEVDLLNKILHYYGEDHYKSVSWEKFQATFDSDKK